MKVLMRPIAIFLALAGIDTASGQIDQVVSGIIQGIGARAQQQQQQQQQHGARNRGPSHKSHSSENDDDESHSHRRASHQSVPSQINGTWIASRTRTTEDGEQVRQIFTIVFADGKASRSLQTTNVISGNSSFANDVSELTRRWASTGTSVNGNKSSVTVQWAPGQLVDWTPKQIPQAMVDAYGSPPSELAAYTINGNELRRANDPRGLTYTRMN